MHRWLLAAGLLAAPGYLTLIVTLGDRGNTGHQRSGYRQADRRAYAVDKSLQCSRNVESRTSSHRIASTIAD